MTEPMIPRLEALIARRRAELPKGSYTTYLFQAGQDKILKKVGEEAAETLLASKNHDRDELVREASDLVYHLLVLLAFHEVPFSEIEAELARRHEPSSREEHA